jgi:hypothetical protein
MPRLTAAAVGERVHDIVYGRARAGIYARTSPRRTGCQNRCCPVENDVDAANIGTLAETEGEKRAAEGTQRVKRVFIVKIGLRYIRLPARGTRNGGKNSFISSRSRKKSRWSASISNMTATVGEKLRKEL